jgi:hypothetical protein
MKSGNLNFLEPSGPLEAWNGTALPLPLFIFSSCTCESVGSGLFTSDFVSEIVCAFNISHTHATCLVYIFLCPLIQCNLSVYSVTEYSCEVEKCFLVDVRTWKNQLPYRRKNLEWHLSCRWCSFDIDIFVNCSWVYTWWQQYSTHLHTNNTQNNTINSFVWKTFWDSNPEWSH